MPLVFLYASDRPLVMHASIARLPHPRPGVDSTVEDGPTYLSSLAVTHDANCHGLELSFTYLSRAGKASSSPAAASITGPAAPGCRWSSTACK